MFWNRWYSVKSYVWSSLWIVPFFALVAGFAVKMLAEHFSAWMVARGFYDLKTGFFALSQDGAHAVLDRIFALNLSCLVFTFGSLLIAIQVAGGQYTPRIIATTLLRDNVIRWIVGFFVFTLLWVNRTMTQLGIEPEVPQFQVFLGMTFGMASLVAFLLLIDYSARLLRPVALAGRIGEQGIAVIESVYPNPTRGANVPRDSGSKRGVPDRTVTHQGKSKVLLAVNLGMLVAQAQRAGAVIELAPQVGDFVGVGEPLFYLYGDAGAIDEHRLRDLAAFGTERTMEQDPVFAFRILVDIASKALSPAINDPTTAVLAIDQLHRLLRRVGMRDLRAEEIADQAGHLRVILRTPNWEDFVHISFREIRQFGSGCLQVARRLRAMIENLIQTLPEHRHAALRAELELLDRVIATQYAFPEDLALARIPDPQGLGGSSRS